MAGQLGEEAEQLWRLTLLARAFTDGLDPDQIVDLVISEGVAGLDADGAVLAMLRPRGLLEVVAVVGVAVDNVARAQEAGPLRVDRALPVCDAVRSAAPVWVGSRDAGHRRYPELADVAPRSDAWAAIPMMSAGSVLGVFSLSFEGEREFSVGDKRYLIALADLCTLALGDRASRRSVNAVRRCRPTR
ncbi:MAG: GAF domain-containing protein [Acidimicrobiia bacterium]